MIDRGDLITIFTTGDRTVLTLAISLLNGSGISHSIRGDLIQDLFGWGRLGGINPAIGPVRILVRQDDAEDARWVLEPMAGARPIRVPPVLRVIAWAVLISQLYDLVFVAILTMPGFHGP